MTERSVQPHESRQVEGAKPGKHDEVRKERRTARVERSERSGDDRAGGEPYNVSECRGENVGGPTPRCEHRESREPDGGVEERCRRSKPRSETVTAEEGRGGLQGERHRSRGDADEGGEREDRREERDACQTVCAAGHNIVYYEVPQIMLLIIWGPLFREIRGQKLESYTTA